MDITQRLRNHALPDPNDEREVMHAPMLREAADEIERLREGQKAMGATIHDLTVAMQSAYIEWQHGLGAGAGMGWIQNTLFGPGLIPDENEPYGKEAQAYWDANNSHPMPKCECGRPSNIVGGGVAGCCRAHFEAAKNKRPNGEVRGASRLAGEASSAEGATSTVVLCGGAKGTK